MKHTIRQLALAGAALVLLMGSAMAEQISLLKTIHIASNDNLNSSRIACAFGDAPRSFAETRTQGVETPDVTTYCVMVMQEAAERDRLFHLYSRMQPGKAGEEWSLVLAASGKGLNAYTNVENVSKVLNCELAFDAGYNYGDANPDQAIAPALSDRDIVAMARRCFEKDPTITTRDALTAGARTAQAHKRGNLILVQR